jgi:hypothetical protein
VPRQRVSGIVHRWSKALLSVAPIVISLAALVVSTRAYRNQSRKDLPFIQEKYATVARSSERPACLQATDRRIHFDACFYQPLRDALGSGTLIYESSVVSESDEFDKFEAVDFILMENVHGAAAGRIDMEVIETIHPYPPLYLLDSLPAGQATTNIYRDDLPPNHRSRRIHLPGLKPAEVYAIPIRLSKPRGDLWKLFNDAHSIYELTVSKVIYYSEDDSVSAALVPRAALRESVLLKDTNDYSIDVHAKVK